MNDEYLIVHTPTGSWVWRLGDPTDEERGHLVGAARVHTGFPATDDWADGGGGWFLVVTQGEPHPSLMARATVDADLSEVDLAAIEAYAADMVDTARRQVSG